MTLPNLRCSWYVYLLPLGAFVAGVVFFWPNYLDDTYIHLRYAENLLRSGRMEYNLGEPSFGCSAPLYVWLLAPVLGLLPKEAWPLVPKIFGVLCHGITIAACLGVYRRVEGRGKAADKARWRWAAAFVITALLCPPLVCRWLQDGMETSFATMLCALGIWALSPAFLSNSHLMVLVLSAGLLGGLRVDLLPHASCLLLATLVLHRGRKTFFAVMLAGVMMIIPHLIIFRIFGTVMPDTAIAKAGGGFSLGWLLSAAISVSAMNPLWILAGSSALYFLFLHWRERRKPSRQLLAVVICVLPLLVVLAAGVLRNQIIQGARYFMPSLLLTGLAALAWSERRDGGGRWCLPGSVVSLIVVLAMTLMRWPQLNVMRHGIRAEFPASLKAGQSVFAADIGIIGWKTGCVIKDYSRLVNGRAVALLSTSAWLRQLADEGMAEGLILDDNDLAALLNAVPGARIDPTSREVEIPAADGRKVSFEHHGVVMVQQTVDHWYEWRLWLRKDR